MKRVPAAVTVSLLPLFLGACGAADGAAGDSEADASPAEQVLAVEITTADGMIGQNHDDEHCVWRSPSYVLRDGGGEIIATGDLDSGVLGEAEAGGEPAQLGEVRSTEPYECVLPTAITAPTADFYELEVSVTQIAGLTFGEDASADLEPVTATVTFSAQEADDTVTVEL